MSQLRLFAVAASLFGTFISLPASAVAQTTQANRTPVLVELFTSEGCSSCPPADALLAKLDQAQPINGAEIIVLGEHVDYWDGQGWHDRFSSHQYTERQNEYCGRLHVDNSFTPQMIVDGTDQFVGNDGAHAVRAIQHAAETTKIKLVLSQPVVDGQKVSASVATPPPAATKKADLYAALVDPKDTTEVRGGENGGHRLQHVGVVRNLQRVGKLKDLGAGPVSFSLNAPADAKPGEMRVVVFAQESGQGAVLGAASAGVTP
ncbi:MAG TPA: DUF1223 domain-containing protein [Edaphobacter sp.]|nr:DUF1223 domain-containing protein [Edaphobacter sp.]